MIYFLLLFTMLSSSVLFANPQQNIPVKPSTKERAVDPVDEEEEEEETDDDVIIMEEDVDREEG